MIELKNITRSYEMGDQTIHALDDVSLTIRDGEYVAIIGPSGSGKSTLMNVIGCLDNPSSGQYLLNSKDVSRLRDDQLADARNKNIGFVFQRFNLMGRMSAVRNVEMPARYGGLNGKDRKHQAIEALTAVGLADRVNHKPVELSGGQQQRVAIARALVNQPNILLADEPTGALDSKTGKDILDLFDRLHNERGITVIVVTHDPTVARRADRVISIRDGCIESDLASAHASTNMNGHAGHSGVVEREPVMATVAERATPVTVNADGQIPIKETAPEEVAALAAQIQNLPKVGLAQSEQFPNNLREDVLRRLPGKQVLKRGLIAIAIAVVVNVALGLLIASRLPMFSPVPIAAFTAILGLVGVGVFALVNRRAKNPASLFRLIAVGALLLSFVPNVVLIANPTMLRQLMVAGGAGGVPGQGQFQGNTPGNAQGGASTEAQGQGGQQGNRANRVPGLGPLGGVLGGNNAQGTGAGARSGGGGLLAIPMVALMALHGVAFGVITGGLTLGLGKKTTAQLNTSGLT